MADAFTEIKRSAEVSNRPGQTDDYKPAELRATTNPEPSYKAAHEERKSPSMQDEMAATAGMRAKAMKALEEK